MMWSIVLLTLAECVEEDAAKIEAKSTEDPTKNATVEQQDTVKENCLRKFFDNNVWLKSVLADATSYAQGSKARDTRITSSVGLDVDSANLRAIAGSKPAEPLPKSDNEDSIFSTDVWPLLKARGWNTTGPGSNPRFVLGEKVRAFASK
jgi:hypothetical protein